MSNATLSTETPEPKVMAQFNVPLLFAALVRLSLEERGFVMDVVMAALEAPSPTPEQRAIQLLFTDASMGGDHDH